MGLLEFFGLKKKEAEQTPEEKPIETAIEDPNKNLACKFKPTINVFGMLRFNCEVHESYGNQLQKSCLGELFRRVQVFEKQVNEVNENEDNIEGTKGF